MKKLKSIPITFRTSPEDKKKIEDLAEDCEKSTSYILKLIVSETLKEENSKYLEEVIRKNFKIPRILKMEL